MTMMVTIMMMVRTPNTPKTLAKYVVEFNTAKDVDMLLCFDKEDDDGMMLLGASPARGEAGRFFPALHRKVYNVLLTKHFHCN